MRKSVVLAVGCFFVLSATSPAKAICSFEKFSGTWQSNDGGTYIVRVLDNDVWWLGMSSDNGETFTNVFKGTRNSSNVITGKWADVRGGFKGHGTLKLQFKDTASMVRISSSGSDFGGRRWWKPCNDVVQNPVSELFPLQFSD